MSRFCGWRGEARQERRHMASASSPYTRRGTRTLALTVCRLVRLGSRLVLILPSGQWTILRPPLSGDVRLGWAWLGRRPRLIQYITSSCMHRLLHNISSPQLLPPSSASLHAHPQTHTLTHHHGLLHRQRARSASPGQPTLGRQPKLHRSATHHARPQGASLHLLRCESTRIPDKTRPLTRRTTSRSRTRTDIPLSNAPERRSLSRTAKVCTGSLHSAVEHGS